MRSRTATQSQFIKTKPSNRWGVPRLFQLVLAIALIAVPLILGIAVPAAAQDEEGTQAAATEEVVVSEESAEVAAPLPGALQLVLFGSDGSALSGYFGVIDAAGAYFEVQVGGGVGSVASLAPGTASVSQLSGTADFQFSPQTIVDIPSGGVAQLQLSNVFMDADGDTVGDSVDACGFGNDFADTDGDGMADACDPTPYGEPTMTPEPAPATEPSGASVTPEPAGGDLTTPVAGDPSATETAEASPSTTAEASPVSESEESTVSVEVADQEAVVESSRISCDQAAHSTPSVISDMADYPPGSLVTLTGDGWVPGQVVEIVVDDDGIADAEQGPWSHSGVATAGSDGRFSYQFTIAPWYVANYTVVAIGECSEARTGFTDSVTGGNCVQVSATDVVTPGQYIMFRCASAQNPIRVGVTSISSGWQWAFIFSNDANLAPPAYSSLNWNTTGTAGDSSASGSIQQAYFFLSPTSAVQPGATGTVSIQIKNPSGSTVLYTSNLLAFRNVTTSDFQMSCTPSSSTVAVPGTQQVNCTLSGINLAPTATINVAIPSLLAPTGWTVTSPSPTSGSVTQAAPFSFSFTFTSSCSASTAAQSVGVNSNLTFRGVAVTGPASSVAIARASGTTASVGISSGSIAWSRAYAFVAYPTNAGNITYGVQASGCSGWNVTITASNFAYLGPNQGNTIAASNLTLTGSTLPSGVGISAPVTSGSLSSSLKVLSASTTNGIGSFSQTLNLNLNIPAGVSVGNYGSTITIAVASGP